MARKSANNLKNGNYFIFEGEPFMVLDNVHSKSGKHGSAKNRIKCESLFTQKKKSVSMTADTSVEIPEIVKRRGQLITIDGEAKTMQVMDGETYETLDIGYPLGEDLPELEKIKNLIADQDAMSETEVEFWTVMGKSFSTRIVLPKY
jgi:translation initiation factor 5A